MDRPFRLRQLLLRISLWGGTLLGSWILAVLLLQALFGRQLERFQTQQLGRDLALNVRLTELTLERYPPALIRELTGLELTVSEDPSAPVDDRGDLTRRRLELQQVLCSRLSHCPQLKPAPNRSGQPEVWIELVSPLEPVWLRSQLPMASSWPPEPTLLLLGLVGSIVNTGVLYLLLEVARPLQRLEQALARVGKAHEPESVPELGAPEVQRLAQRFNAMVQRLEANRQERATMLGGIAHDLRAPITRLQFRMSLPSLNAAERQRCSSDLESLERITGQFLLYAGAGEREELVHCPLDQWLAELAAGYSADELHLQVEPLQGWIRPVALGRAITNLIDNSFSYGKTPVVISLRQDADTIEIAVWDQGTGIPEDLRSQALQPFQRLDNARGSQGHCGLGLAIVSHVAQSLNGRVSFQEGANDTPGCFAVVLHIPLDGPKRTRNPQRT